MGNLSSQNKKRASFIPSIIDVNSYYVILKKRITHIGVSFIYKNEVIKIRFS